MIDINNFFIDYESNILIYFKKEKLSNGIKELIDLKKRVLEKGYIEIDNEKYNIKYIEILDKINIFLFLISIETLKNGKTEDYDYASRVKII